MKRLMSTVGTWQLLLLVASLREKAARENGQGYKGKTEDILIIYGAGLTEPVKEWIIQVATLLWDWERILDCTDLMDTSIGWDNDECRLKLESVKTRLGVDEFDEIWVCRLLYQQEKLLLETYRSASVHLYEDGLENYLPSYEVGCSIRESFDDPLGFAKWVTRAILDLTNLRGRIKRRGPYSGHMKRVQEVYLFIVEDLDPPRSLAGKQCICISAETLLKVINDCKKVLRISSVMNNMGGGSHNILILGESFSLFNMMTEEQERQIYTTLVGSVIDKGYTVLWKDHPRCGLQFYPGLKRIFKEKIQAVSLEPYVPIELIADTLNVSACISCTSSSLFYLPRLFQIETYTFSYTIDPGASDGERYLHELIAGNVKLFEMLPKSRS